MEAHKRNADDEVIKGFGEEWSTFDQANVDHKELEEIFNRYFSLFPWEQIGEEAEGFDMGCGSGRWAAFVAPRVRRLHCIDPSAEALRVATHRLDHLGNCEMHLADVQNLPLLDSSMDFGYSLGVLHHVPDPHRGLKGCVKKLKPGAPFLLYLYYALENRPRWYRWVWRLADVARRIISRLPFRARLWVTTGLAATIYWPATRIARVVNLLFRDAEGVPLAFYRDKSFYTMKTDAFDRFGTRVEHRFTAEEIQTMMQSAGLERIKFRSGSPYWCALGYKAS